MENDYAAPDPYAAGISSMRAAEATPESRFAERYADMRTREFALQQAEIDAYIAAEPRLTAAEEADLATYEPPDPYAAGIRALQQKETR